MRFSRARRTSASSPTASTLWLYLPSSDARPGDPHLGQERRQRHGRPHRAVPHRAALALHHHAERARRRSAAARRTRYTLVPKQKHGAPFDAATVWIDDADATIRQFEVTETSGWCSARSGSRRSGRTRRWMPPRSPSPSPRACASSIADRSHRTTTARGRAPRGLVLVRGGDVHRLVAPLTPRHTSRSSVRQPFTLAPAMTHPSVMRRARAGALVLITRPGASCARRPVGGGPASDDAGGRGGARRSACAPRLHAHRRDLLLRQHRALELVLRPASTGKGVTLGADDRRGARPRRFAPALRAQLERLRHGQEHHAPRGHPARHRGGRPARSAPLRARFQQVLPQRVRRAGRVDGVGMARRGPPSLGELHGDRPRRAGGVARLLRRESRQGALRSARGAAHPRRRGGSRARAREDARRQAARRSRSSPTRRSWRSRRATIRRPARSSPKDCAPPT